MAIEQIKASFAQRRLWSAMQLDPDPGTYNIPVALKLNGLWERSRIEAALAALANKHEILRTFFRVEDGSLLQCIQERVEPQFEVRTFGVIAAVPADVRNKSLREDALRPFEVESESLWRSSLWVYESAEESIHRDPVLLVVVHHLLADGASMQQLCRDFSRALDGQTIDDPEILSYADLSEWEHEHLRGETGKAEIDELYQQLQSAPRSVLDTQIQSRRSSVGGQGPAKRIRRSLDDQAQRLLRGYAAKGTTPFMLLLSALWAHLYRSGAGSELCVGTIMAARTRPELQEVVGPLANTVVLAFRMQPDWSHAELVTATREGVLASYHRQHLPLEPVLSKLRIPRRANEHPLFDLMFLVQPHRVSEPNPGSPEVIALELGPRSAKFPLTLSWESDASGRWELVADIATERWSGDSGESFVAGYIETLRVLLQEPKARIAAPVIEKTLSNISVGGSDEGDVSKRLSSLSDQERGFALAQLLEVVRELFGYAGISEQDDFFEIGGDSIVATQISQRLVARGYRLSVLDVFDHSRFSELAGRMELLEEKASHESLPPDGDAGKTQRDSLRKSEPSTGLSTELSTGLGLGESPRFDVPYAEWEELWLSPSPLQQGLLYHSAQKNKGSVEPGVYMQQFCLRFEGYFDRGRWQRAWDRVLARFSTLRSHFQHRCDGIRLKFLPIQGCKMPLRIHDGALGTADAREACLADLRGEAFGEGERPLMRCDVWLDGDAHAFDWVWTYHHALLDGWSASKVLAEVAEAYRDDPGEEHGEGVSPGEKNSPDRWPEYIRSIASLDHRAQAQRIADRCRDYPALRSSGLTASQKPHLLEIQHSVDRDTTTRLRQRAAQNRVTIQGCLLAAWALVRSHFAGQRRFCLGTTVSGRDTYSVAPHFGHEREGKGIAELEDMVGMMMNTLPLAIDVTLHRSLRDWIQVLMRDQLALGAAATVPLNEIQKHRGGSDFDAKPTPLFEELWVFENYPIASSLSESLPELKLCSTSNWDASHYGLAVVASVHEEAKLRVCFDEQRYAAKDVRRWVQAVDDVLRLWSQEEDWNLLLDRRLGPLRAAIQLPETFSRSAPPTIVSRLEGIFARDSAKDTTAVIDEEREWSYADLRRLSDHWVDELLPKRQAQAFSSPVQSQLVIVAAVSASMIAAQIAALRCGWMFVPLSPDLPIPQLRSRLAELQPTALVVDPGLELADLGIEASQIVLRSDSKSALLCRPGHPGHPGYPGHPGHPWQLQELVETCVAYGILTSGSSGRPKLVEVPHVALAHLVTWHSETYSIEPGTRVSAIASPGFDASIWDIWPALNAGATLVVAPSKLRRSPDDLAQWIEEQAIEDCFVPTAIVHRWDRGTWPQSAVLRRIRTGGERLLSLSSSASCPVINHYGPTEYTVVATAQALDDRGQEAELPPIGSAIDRSVAYVLGPDFYPVPEGTIGELFLSGGGEALGYANNPKKTAEAWMPDPFSGRRGARMYRTGDFVYQKDGVLHYVERKDRQVQLQGNRIELGEIEAVIGRDPSVSQVAVLVDGENKTLIAFVTPEQDEAELWECRKRVAAQLTAASVPKRWVALSSLPYNDSGKVDYRELMRHRRLDEQPVQAARTPEELTLVDILRSLLGEGRWGVEQDFFAIGGDSMTSVQLIARARARGLHLEAGDVEEQRNLRALAQLHERRGRERRGAGPTKIDFASNAARINLEQGELDKLCQTYPWLAPTGKEASEAEKEDKSVGTAYLATPIQAGMLFVAQDQAAQEASGPAHYVQEFQLEVSLPFCAKSFERSFRQLVHEFWVLRVGVVHSAYRGTIFVECPAATLEPWIDTAIRIGDDSARLQWRQEASQSLAKLDTPLLWRNFVKLSGKSKFELCCLHHHAILDGWSVSRLLSRWFQIYESLRRSRPTPPRPPGSYLDYLSFFHARVQSAGAEERRGPESNDLAFTELGEQESSLGGVNRTKDGPDKMLLAEIVGSAGGELDVAGALESAHGEWTLALPSGLADRLRRLSTDPRFSLSTLTMAAFAQTLAFHTHRLEVTFALSYADRNPHIPNVEEIVGLMLGSECVGISVLAQRSRPQWWEDIDRSIHAQGSARLGGKGEVARSSAKNADSDVLYVFENYPLVLEASEDIAMRSQSGAVQASAHRTHYALSFVVLPRQDLNICLQWDRRRLPDDWVMHFGADFVALLFDYAKKPEALVGSWEPYWAKSSQPRFGPQVSRPRPQPETSNRPSDLVSERDRGENGDHKRPGAIGDASDSGRAKLVIELCSEVLGGVDLDETSNFLELGGDSVSSMQLVARLRERGVHCNTRDVLESENLAELVVRIAAKAQDSGKAAPGRDPTRPAQHTFATGELMTPVQAWFIAQQQPHPEYFNQSLWVELQHRMDPILLQKWLRQLCRRHPALVAPGEELDQAWPLTVIEAHDLEIDGMSQEGEEEQSRAEEVLRRQHQSLCHIRGPRCRALYCKGSKRDRLFLVIHHWVVDAVSWRLLVDELTQLAESSATELPALATFAPEQGMSKWVEALRFYLQTPAAAAELNYWEQQNADGVLRLPLHLDLDHNLDRKSDPKLGSARVVDARSIESSLDSACTKALEQRCARDWKVSFSTALMVALAEALAKEWGQAGTTHMKLAVEGHGREVHTLARSLSELPKADGLISNLGQDLTMGVGWFTSVSPRMVPLRAKRSPKSAQLSRFLADIHAEMQRVPLSGAGFLALKYLGDAEQRQKMAACDLGEVSWNYLGRMDLGSGHSMVHGMLKDPAPSQHPQNYRAFPIDASGYIKQGGLCLNLSYCSRLLSASSIRRVMEAWIDCLRQWSDPSQDLPARLAGDEQLAEVAAILGLELEAEKQS